MTPEEFWKEVHRIVRDYETTGEEARYGIGLFLGEMDELAKKWDEGE